MKIISLLATGFQNDNRVQRMAETIQSLNAEIMIVAWKKGDAPEKEMINGIPIHRLFPSSSKWKRSNKIIGLIQFLHFNIAVIQQYRKVDIWHCNDFEAFWMGIFAKMLNPKLKLIYDLHEYQKERLGTPWYVKKVIGWVEKLFISKAERLITISPGIREEYTRLYGVQNIALVRNTPHLTAAESGNVFREKFHILPRQKIFLYQGMLGPDRGIEELISTFEQRTSDDAVLIIMGQGKLQNLVNHAAERSPLIFHHPYVSYSEINAYTGSADVGLNMAKDSCLNHRYCLPNKIFEYIQAQLPILTNHLIDCSHLIQQYEIGSIIFQYTPEGINAAIDHMLQLNFAQMKRNLILAKSELNWEKEQSALIEVYKPILTNSSREH
jgi:glycosyltransferase involved in cell wall biosynthesis